MPGILLVDISNTFTKVTVARGGKIGRVLRFATPGLCAREVVARFGKTAWSRVVAASVVPSKKREIDDVAPGRVTWVGPGLKLGVGIDYPNPSAIGPDRLANAAGCAEHFGVPAIVVDFGTAVTFDVISRERNYIGGVIAPGLSAMTEYLHDRTALLPLIRLREPSGVVGRSTRDAMLSGAVHGYRGLVREIIAKITREEFGRQRPKIVATGGDAELIGASLGIFTDIDPLLTLRGLLVIAELNDVFENAKSTRRRSVPSSRSGKRAAS